MYDKTGIYNLTLIALSITKKIADAATDTSREILTFNTLWDAVWTKSLMQLDLDSTTEMVELALIDTAPNNMWAYVYEYPANCAFLRRIVSERRTDDDESNIDKLVARYEGEKAIFTDQVHAYAEIIPDDIEPEDLSAEACLFLSYSLALAAVPLIVGKDADQTRKNLQSLQAQAFADATARDANESTVYQPEWMKSELVKHRLS